MFLHTDKLGKVAITVEEDYWSNDKDYDKLTIVEKEGLFGTFISRKPVPAGTPLTDRKFWIPFSSLKEEIVIAFNNLISDLNDTKEIIDEKEENLYKAISSIVAGGVALRQEFGDSEEFGISQKALTEFKDSIEEDVNNIKENIGDDETEGSLNKRIKDVEDIIGTDSSEETIKGRLGQLENAVGEGGSIDDRIEEAKTEERTRAEGVEQTLLDAIGALGQADIIVGPKPAASAALPRTIYRVPGTNSYTDWAITDSDNPEWVELATYDNATDDAPTASSNNLVKSGGVYTALEKKISIISSADAYAKRNTVLDAGQILLMQMTDGTIAYQVGNGTAKVGAGNFLFVGKGTKTIVGGTQGSKYVGGGTKWRYPNKNTGVISSADSGTDIRVRFYDISQLEGKLLQLQYYVGGLTNNSGYSIFKKVYITEEPEEEGAEPIITDELVPYANYDFSNAENVLTHATAVSPTGVVNSNIEVPQGAYFLAVAYYNNSSAATGNKCGYNIIEPVDILSKVEQAEENITTNTEDIEILDGRVDTLEEVVEGSTIEHKDITEYSKANTTIVDGKIVLLSENGAASNLKYGYYIIGEKVTSDDPTPAISYKTVNTLPLYSLNGGEVKFKTVRTWSGTLRTFGYARVNNGTGLVYIYGSGTTNNRVQIFDISEYAGQIIKVYARLAGTHGNVGWGASYSVFKDTGDAVEDYDFQNTPENVLLYGDKVGDSWGGYRYVYLPENAKFIALSGYNGSGGYRTDVYAINTEDTSEAVVELQENVEALQTDLATLQNNTYASNDAYRRNKHKEILLNIACRRNFDSDGSKSFQLLLINDTHGNTTSIDNAVKMANGFATIDAMIHDGDWEPSYYMSQSDVGVSKMTASVKPAFPVIGNHDGGNKASLKSTATQNQLYNRYILPFINAGHISIENGDIVAGNNYYYKDFATRKIRLIVLNDYDGDDNAFNETYWTPIEYDSSYPSCTKGTAYTVGDKVNCGKNTEYSFECVQNVTPSGDPSGSPTGYPAYAYSRGTVCFRQAQLEWLATTLLSTPSGYGVIMAGHWLPGAEFNTLKCSFSYNVTSESGTSLCKVDYVDASNQGKDAVIELVEAFRNRTAFSKDVVYTGGASYMNDAVTGKAFTLSADFTQLATGVKFMCYICGHGHSDMVYKHHDYHQYAVSPCCGYVKHDGSSSKDIVRSTSNNEAYDCITVLSTNIESNNITLIKLGVDKTITGKKREYMILNITNGTVTEEGVSTPLDIDDDSEEQETDPTTDRPDNG